MASFTAVAGWWRHSITGCWVLHRAALCLSSWCPPLDTDRCGCCTGPMASLGERFARAVAAKDHTAVRDVLAPDVDFRALTPGRAWEGAGPDAVVDTLFGHW